MLNKESCIFIAGHNGMVGSAINRLLVSKGYHNIITAPRSELDLTRQEAVENFLDRHPIDIMIIAAAKVGGIGANSTYPAEFLYENLMIETNLIHGAYKAGIGQLLFLGSSCIYPKSTKQPINEEQLLTGALEPTNEPYAIAKIAGLKLCESYHRQYGCDFRALMPTNLYGPGDNYHPDNSHVIPALIRKFVEAKQNKLNSVEIWGTGEPLREFLHVDDLARATMHTLRISPGEYWKICDPTGFLNVGTSSEISIANLARLLAELINFKGSIIFNSGFPDGTHRKLLNSTKLVKSGWSPRIELRQGLLCTLEESRTLLIHESEA